MLQDVCHYTLTSIPSNWSFRRNSLLYLRLNESFDHLGLSHFSSEELELDLIGLYCMEMINKFEHQAL